MPLYLGPERPGFIAGIIARAGENEDSGGPRYFWRGAHAYSG